MTVGKDVGLQGFEPWTSCTRDRRSTKLSHSPKNQPRLDRWNRRPAQRCYIAHFTGAGK